MNSARIVVALLVGLILWPENEAVGQSLELEMGRMNFGPIVTEETENFVRFGTNDGQATYLGISFVNDRWWSSLRAAPTSVYVWDVEDTEAGVGHPSSPDRHTRPANPIEGGRFHYRVQGHKDDFVWLEFLGGIQERRNVFEGRLGGGIVQPAGTRHNFWGAKVSPKPVLEVSLGASWRSVSLRCRGALIHVGEPFGRWSVLESAARGGDLGDSSIRRNIKPLACGGAVRMSFE